MSMAFLKPGSARTQWHPINPTDTLLLGFGVDPTVLVRERVSTYAEQGSDFPAVENYDSSNSWGGDQGLILNALAGYSHLFPEDPLPGELLRPLLLGYVLHMTVKDEEGVYVPYACSPFSGWGDPGDYKSGIGVFMRGVLQAFQVPGSPLEKDMPGFQDWLSGVVKWAQAQDLGQADLFDCLNVLATLTLGMALQS